MTPNNLDEETNVPVDGKTDLCLRMMVHASLDDQHGDLTHSEALKHLAAFFPSATIESAGKLATDGWLPPRADLAFYSANAVVHGKFLPDNPTQFDYLHAIRAIASRISNNQVFDLADAAMNLPNVQSPPTGGKEA
jgi:hypothetical protein